jgi:hypothetical protein
MATNKTIPVPLNAIWGVIEYLAHDESKDYFGYIEGGEDTDHHIYVQVIALIHYLASIQEYADAANEMIARYEEQLDEALAAREESK